MPPAHQHPRRGDREHEAPRDVLGFSAREVLLDIHDETCELYRIDRATSRTTSLEITLAEHPAARGRFTP